MKTIVDYFMYLSLVPFEIWAAREVQIPRFWLRQNDGI
jgi:hypothetical protein